jgi:hypothetical protein
MIIKIDKKLINRYLQDDELENQLNKLVNKLLDIEISKHEAEYKK